MAVKMSIRVFFNFIEDGFPFIYLMLVCQAQHRKDVAFFVRLSNLSTLFLNASLNFNTISGSLQFN